MKKLKAPKMYLSYRDHAREVIVYRYYILSSAVSILIMCMINYTHLFVKVKQWVGLVFMFALLVLITSMKYFAIRFAIWKKMDTRLGIKLTQKYRRRWARYLEAKERLRIEKLEFQKDLYKILSVTPVETLYNFCVELSQDFDEEYPPLFSVNDIAIPLRKSDKSTGIIHVGKFLIENGDKENWIFKVGNNESLMKNPYLIKNDNIKIDWQCEGESKDRKISIPTEFLKNPTIGVVYHFSININNVSQGDFYGKIIGKNIIVPLGKKICKNEILNKECALRYSYGKFAKKLILPKSKVLTT